MSDRRRMTHNTQNFTISLLSNVTQPTAPDSPMLRILLVEDSPDDAELIELALRRAGIRFVAERVETEAGLRESLPRANPHVVLCDYHLPRFSCHGALAVAEEVRPGLPVIVVSRHISEAEASEVLRRGAKAWVRKDRLCDLASKLEPLALKSSPPPAPPLGAA